MNFHRDLGERLPMLSIVVRTEQQFP